MPSQAKEMNWQGFDTQEYYLDPNEPGPDDSLSNFGGDSDDDEDDHRVGGRGYSGSDDVLTRYSATIPNPHDRDFFLYDGRPYNNICWTYRFPVDQEEVVRMDRQHFVMLRALPGLYRGPVDAVLSKPGRARRLLDMGCGTGIWVSEMAERFSHVDCVGIDVVPLTHDCNLRNCTFSTVQIPNGLRIFPDASFDVVHLRQMQYSIPDYPAAIRHAKRLLRPGGLVLIHDPEPEFTSTREGLSAEDLMPAFVEYNRQFRAAIAYRGIDTMVFYRTKELLHEEGFAEDKIHEDFHYRPVCPGEGDQWAMHETENSRSFIRATRLILHEGVDKTREELDQIEADAYAELMWKSKGKGGPTGGVDVVCAWGYWWAQKDG